MSEIKDGGPAFPRVPFDVNDYTGDGSPGMTLRDWFAGQALAFLSDPASSGETNYTARYAYAIADAMIAAREVGAA